MSSQLSPHSWFPEPKLIFHPDRTSDVEIHPLRGLLHYGPYSAGLVLDPIRVATIAPVGETDHLYTFMKRINSTHEPKERTDYLPAWPGFQGVFGLHLRGAGDPCHIELDQDLENMFEESRNPHTVLAESLGRTIQRLQMHRAKFDVVVIYIPRRWARGYVGTTHEEFDLHDHLKGTTAALGLPIQLVREDKALAYHCQASVMWHMELALYVKGWRGPVEASGERSRDRVH